MFLPPPQTKASVKFRSQNDTYSYVLMYLNAHVLESGI